MYECMILILIHSCNPYTRIVSYGEHWNIMRLWIGHFWSIFYEQFIHLHNVRLGHRQSLTHSHTFNESNGVFLKELNLSWFFGYFSKYAIRIASPESSAFFAGILHVDWIIAICSGVNEVIIGITVDFFWQDAITPMLSTKTLLEGLAFTIWGWILCFVCLFIHVLRNI